MSHLILKLTVLVESYSMGSAAVYKPPTPIVFFCNFRSHANWTVFTGLNN